MEFLIKNIREIRSVRIGRKSYQSRLESLRFVDSTSKRRYESVRRRENSEAVALLKSREDKIVRRESESQRAQRKPKVLFAILRDRWEKRPLSRMLTLGCENTRRARKIARPTFEKRFILESEGFPSSRVNSSSSSPHGNPENGLFHGKLHGALTSRFGTTRLPPEPFRLPFFLRCEATRRDGKPRVASRESTLVSGKERRKEEEEEEEEEEVAESVLRWRERKQEV
ncbi:LOW QUALITY PROTEIN: hypothetical protein V1478_009986 [Vespula squamosa]|uniref:Uncharacterized protein n=1 Tax=Vespula squamosa TaxID=30214 RepID=A0ABD2AM56_VESSQ